MKFEILKKNLRNLKKKNKLFKTLEGNKFRKILKNKSS